MNLFYQSETINETKGEKSNILKQRRMQVCLLVHEVVVPRVSVSEGDQRPLARQVGLHHRSHLRLKCLQPGGHVLGAVLPGDESAVLDHVGGHHEEALDHLQAFLIVAVEEVLGEHVG